MKRTIWTPLLMLLIFLGTTAHAEKGKGRTVLEGFFVYSGGKLDDLYEYLATDWQNAPLFSGGGTTATLGGSFTIQVAIEPNSRVNRHAAAFPTKKNKAAAGAGTSTIAAGLTSWFGPSAIQGVRDSYLRAERERLKTFKQSAAFRAFQEIAPFEADSYAYNLVADWDLKHLLVKYGGTEEEKKDLLAKFSKEREALEEIILDSDVPSKEERNKLIERMAAELTLLRLILEDESEENQKSGLQKIEALKEKLRSQIKKQRDDLALNAMKRRNAAQGNHK